MIKKYPLAVGMFFAGLMAFSYVSSKSQMCHIPKGNIRTSVEKLDDGFVFSLTGKNARDKNLIKEALMEKAKYYHSRFPGATVQIFEDGGTYSLVVKGVSGSAPMCPYKSKRNFQTEKKAHGTDTGEVTL